jgi:natural product precursor
MCATELKGGLSMVTKSRKGSTGAKRGRVKLGKLKLKKETVKNLSESEVKNIKGGAIPSLGVQVRSGGCTQGCPLTK